MNDIFLMNGLEPTKYLKKDRQTLI